LCATHNANNSFSVTATPSLGTLHYQWIHAGNPVGTDSSTLNIVGVVGQDYGEYHCVVSDDCGPVSSNSANLQPETVSNKTKGGAITDMVVEPSVQLGCVDDSVTFTVIDAPGGSTFDWRKDGTSIGETGQSLTLSGLTFGSAGAYDCVVTTGSLVQVSHDGVLLMGDDPVITNQPDNWTISNSQTVIFQVQVIGVGPFTYQWRYSSPSGTNNFHDIQGANDATLMIQDADGTAAGRYRCKVTSPCGVTLSAIARLIFI